MTESKTELPLRKRHALGRAHFAQVLGWWLARGKLTHKRIEVISAWINRDRRAVSSSQLSHIRNATIKNPNWLLIEGLCNINLAIHKWQTEGPEACFKVWGPLGEGQAGEAAMEEAIWLPMPDSDVPLQFSDWCDLFTGRITLPYVDEVILAPRDPNRINEELPNLLEGLIEGLGLGFRHGLTELLRNYPVEDEVLRQRFKALVLGEVWLQADEIQEELPRIAITVERTRDLDPGSYGEQQLWEELTSNRKRT